VKTALLGYFRHDGYKLLDKTTGAVFKSRDIIFEEGTTHLAKQLTPTVFFNDNNPFTYIPQHISITDNYDNDLALEPIPPPIQGIVPRPLAVSDLHKDSNSKQTISTANNTTSGTTHKEPNNTPDDLPLVLRRSHRTIKPSTYLQESIEYLNRPIANNVESEN